jgi:mycothiol synthase
VRIFGYALVTPQHRDRGIGTRLVGLLDDRGAAHVDMAPAGEEVTISQEVGPHNAAAVGLLQAHGYEHVRRFWEMGIELTGEVPEPEWPDGVRLETLVEGEERKVYDMMREAFRDHWGFTDHPYE